MKLVQFIRKDYFMNLIQILILNKIYCQEVFLQKGNTFYTILILLGFLAIKFTIIKPIFFMITGTAEYLE